MCNRSRLQISSVAEGGVVPTASSELHCSEMLVTLTFLGPAKRWNTISADRQKREILVVCHHHYNNWVSETSPTLTSTIEIKIPCARGYIYMYIHVYVYVIARAGVIFGIYFTSCRYSGG